MTVRMMTYDEIPFNELTQEYIFDAPMNFKPKHEIKGQVDGFFGQMASSADHSGYLEWTSGEKVFMIRKGNRFYVKSNYLIVEDKSL